MKCAVDSANSFGSQTETSEGQANVSRAQTDASNASNKAETVGISHGDGASTYLGAMDAKRGVDATDGVGSHTDTSNGLTDVPSVQMDAITTANATQNVSTGPTEPKPPDLPGEGGRWAPTEPNGFYSHADMAIGHGDAQSIQTDALMPANVPETVSIRPLELKTPNSPPGSARERAEHPNGLRNRADTTSGPTDVQSVAHETETAANASKTVSTRPNIPKPPNSPSGDVKHIVDETDGVGHYMDMPNVQTDVLTPANDSRNIKMRQNGSRTPDSPAGSATLRSDTTDGFGNCTDTSNSRTDVHSVGNDAKPTKNETESVRTPRNRSKMQNSPHTRETATPKPTCQWKQVSLRGINVHVPQIGLIDTTNRMFIFGRAESAGEAVVARIVDEMTGDGDGNRNGGDGDVHGTTSSGHVHSRRAEKALLAADSQHTRSSQVSRRYNSPVPPRPPIQSAERPNGPARHHRRRGSLKIE